MRNRILLVVVAVASLSGVADAHFVLVSPAASLVQNRLGIRRKSRRAAVYLRTPRAERRPTPESRAAPSLN